MRAPRNCKHCGALFVPTEKQKCCSAACATARRTEWNKRRWQENAAYRETMREVGRATLTKAWQRDDYRAARERQTRERWEDPDYRAEMSEQARETMRAAWQRDD